MRWDRFISLNLVRPVRTLMRRDGSGKLPILMYHSISDDPETDRSPYYKVCTSPIRFREQMAWLHQHGYRSAGLDEIAGDPAGMRVDPHHKVVITFDDGFRDNFTHALPILEEFGFSATVYLPTAFIGERTRQRFLGRDCLTWSEVREMRGRGINFGSHTVSHPKLYGMPWDEITGELHRSRQTIEDRLGETIASFAYPYAFPQQDRWFVEKFMDLVRESGFTTSVTTKVGRVSSRDNPLALKRLPMNSEDRSELFRAKMDGSYDWLARAQMVRKRLRAGARQGSEKQS